MHDNSAVAEGRAGNGGAHCTSLSRKVQRGLSVVKPGVREEPGAAHWGERFGERRGLEWLNYCRAARPAVTGFQNNVDKEVRASYWEALLSGSLSHLFSYISYEKFFKNLLSELKGKMPFLLWSGGVGGGGRGGWGCLWGGSWGEACRTHTSRLFYHLLGSPHLPATQLLQFPGGSASSRGWGTSGGSASAGPTGWAVLWLQAWRHQGLSFVPLSEPPWPAMRSFLLLCVPKLPFTGLVTVVIGAHIFVKGRVVIWQN